MARALRWLLVLSVWSTAAAAWACEFVDGASVYGVLGRPNLTVMPMTEARLPRNPAFVFFDREPGRPQLTAADTPVELELLGAEPAANHFGLQTARELLDPGVMYTYDAVAFTVDDYVDEVAPEPVRIVDATFSASEGGGACGLGNSSCGESASVTVQIEPGTDDHAPRSGLTYAVYLGASAEAAARTPQVERFLLEENGTIFFRADYGWTETDMYFAVSVLDHAGNESARSKPFHLASERSGCRVVGSSSFGSFVWVMVALLWHALRRRGARA